MRLPEVPASRSKLRWFFVIFIPLMTWPISILFGFLYFLYLLRDFLKNMREVSFKLSFSNIEFFAKSDSFIHRHLGEENYSNRYHSNKKIVQGRRSKLESLTGAKILWVDDIPTNNASERARFEQQGVQFTISTSTEDALTKIYEGAYDLIISDMGRPPDNRAGYTLLSTLQEMEIHIPFIIYSGSNLPEHKVEARSRGAVGATNHFSELYQLVTDAILSDD